MSPHLDAAHAFKDVISACLTKDAAARPSAAELLRHRFFKQAKDSAFLQRHFLSSVPPPARSHRARAKQGLRVSGACHAATCVAKMYSLGACNMCATATYS
jgi:serine/threonine protein kinase